MRRIVARATAVLALAAGIAVSTSVPADAAATSTAQHTTVAKSNPTVTHNPGPVRAADWWI